MHEGGCFCGAVRYEAEGPVLSSTLCHCSMCRRMAGAPCVAWFTVPHAGLRFTAGTPAAFHSSPGVTRRFCAACGTQLTFEDERSPGEIDVTTASLDEPDSLPPADHTFMQSRLRWLHLADGLPRYLRTRSEGA
jgi:hypothetical protein